MSIAPDRTPKIVELAARLEEDILGKGLQAGDPYLSTVDAARMLGVSTVSANRALQLLVKRDLLDRRQGRGTFIAHRDAQPKDSPVEKVRVLIHQQVVKAEGAMADGVILGIQEVLPKAEIQINFLPAHDEESFTNRVVAETLGSKRTEGYVLVRAPLAVQRIIHASGLPAVIHGTPFPSISGIPWIDRDNYQAGRIAVNRLLRAGFRSLTMITREDILPGDFVLFDGVRDEMSAAQLPIDSLIWRPLPSDAEVVRHAVADLLRQGKPRQGFICHSAPLAEGTIKAIEQVGTEVGVVLLAFYQASGRQTPKMPYLMPAVSPEEIGQQMGRFLLRQAQGLKPQPGHAIFPMNLLEGAGT